MSIQHQQEQHRIMQAMDTNIYYIAMEPTPILEAEFNSIPQESFALTDCHYYQPQDLQYSPVFDSTSYTSPQSFQSYAPSTSAPSTSYGTTNDFESLDANFDFIDNILEADISNEQMTELIKDFDLNDFENFASDYNSSSEYSQSTTTTPQSSPKRKISSDSSCYSYDFSESTASPSPSPFKRPRKKRATLPDRAERKKEQNKRAAIKYREKKKSLQEQSTENVVDLEEKHDELAKQLASLQNELNVILPLAQASFASNSFKNHQLQLLLGRISNLMSP